MLKILPNIKIWVLSPWLVFQLVFLWGQERGQVISDSLYFHLDKQQIDSLYNEAGILSFLAPIEYEVDVYRIEYFTQAPTGDSLTTASGLMVLPRGPCLWPSISYQHGTLFYGDEPTRLGAEWIIGLTYGTGGYLALLPDYLGYGSSPISIPHPYVHASSEASATVDMIKASRLWCQSRGIGLSDQLFLTGYSQGGHATLATQRALEAQQDLSIRITANAAGSGPYDLSGVSKDYFLDESGDASSFFLAFLMTSYQYVYGNLWDQPEEAFVPPYDVLVPEYFNRADPRPVPLPETAVQLLQPAYVEAVLSDPNHPARLALKDNDLYSWTPGSPLRLYYCEGDRTVLFENSLIARDSFINRGASQVEAISNGASLDHGSCFFPMLIASRGWFDGLKDSCRIDSSRLVGLGWGQEVDFSVYPQPTGDVINFLVPQANLRYPLTVSILDLTGRPVKTKVVTPRDRHVLWVGDLPEGIYWIGLRTPNRTFQSPLRIIR